MERAFLKSDGALSRVDPTCHLKNDPITSNQVGQAVHIPLESSNFDSCEVQSGGGQDDQEDHRQSEATESASKWPQDNYDPFLLTSWLKQICENSEVERSEKLVLVLENDDKDACWTSPINSEGIF